MPKVTLPAAPLTGGVSTQPFANRFATQTTTSDNTLLYINRGLEKRFGGDFISDLDYTDDYFDGESHWVRRDSDTVYVVIVDRNHAAGSVVQVFGVDGIKKTVTVTDAAAEAYIQSGTGKSIDVIRVKTYGDTTFILNQTVTTATTGTATTYSNLTNSDSLPVPATGTVGHHINLTSNQVGYPLGVYKILQAGPTTVGPWYERQESPFADSQLDATTMPVKLVYNPATDTLSLELITWDVRLSGDELVNPPPSFIGKSLNKLVLFEKRLWLSADQQVVSSQVEDLFNYWQDDWSITVDSDRIDITLGGGSVSSAEFMIPFDKTLLIIADGSVQWELQSLGGFTPSDVNLVETTNYSVSKQAEPRKIGNQLYFISDQGRFSYMWEYFPNFDRDANLGNNVTNHAEGYLPERVRRLATSENNNLVFAWSADEVNKLYVYFTYWQTTEKQQSSWCRFVFDSDVIVKSHAAIDNTLYVILFKDDVVWMESIPITVPDFSTDGSFIDETFALTTETPEDLTTEAGDVLILEVTESTGVGYHANMDKKTVVTGVYAPATKLTTFTLPFTDSAMNTVVLADQWGDRKGQVITSLTPTPTTMTVSGDFSEFPVILGKSYNMSFELSPPFVKDDSNIAVQGNLQLKTLDISFKGTTFFTVDITPRGRETTTRKFISNRFGSAILGEQNIQEYGRYKIHVRGNAQDTTIVINNDSPFPSLFTNLEFVGGFTPKKKNPAKR